jgi:hypothetical protein
MSINVECEDMFLSSGATSLRGVSIYAIWRSRAKRAHTSRLSVASRIFGSFSVCACKCKHTQAKYTLLAPLHEQLLRNINGCTGRDYTCSGALTVSKQYVYAGREQYC